MLPPSKTSPPSTTIFKSTLIGKSSLPPTPAQIQAKLDLYIAITLFSWPALSIAVQNNWGGGQSGDKREWFAGAVSELLAVKPGSTSFISTSTSISTSTPTSTSTYTTTAPPKASTKSITRTTDIEDEVSYLEEFLLGVMDEEFETCVEDGSAEEVAWRIVEAGRKIRRGEFAVVDEAVMRYEARERKGEAGIGLGKVVEGLQEKMDVDAGDDGEEDGDRVDEEDHESGEEEDEDEDEDEDGDVEMAVEEPSPAKTTRVNPIPEVDEDGFTKVATRRKR